MCSLKPASSRPPSSGANSCKSCCGASDTIKSCRLRAPVQLAIARARLQDMRRSGSHLGCVPLRLSPSRLVATAAHKPISPQLPAELQADTVQMRALPQKQRTDSALMALAILASVAPEHQLNSFSARQ